MRLSEKRISELQRLLKKEFGLDYTTEESQRAALAIMRFIVSKHRRSNKLLVPKEGTHYETIKSNKRSV